MTPTALWDRLAESEFEPIPDEQFGVGYRCAVWLADGTHLPCVFVRRIGPYADRLREMVSEELRGAGSYRFCRDPLREALKTQLACGNQVSAYDIKRVEPSPYAIPLSLLRQVSGETAMSYTAFILETKDGRRVSFDGHPNALWFFDLPAGTSFSDFVIVRNIRDKPGRKVALKTCQARPYFECYVNDEPFVADLAAAGLE